MYRPKELGYLLIGHTVYFLCVSVSFLQICHIFFFIQNGIQMKMKQTQNESNNIFEHNSVNIAIFSALITLLTVPYGHCCSKIIY